uniref:Uncharacterized protein n=1 Tax=Rhizophagus irregularis (strain DAOM 181602 / DAOM 197198 / MUCL 43194) TaxID=747089 RepID=U9T705_RHIID
MDYERFLESRLSLIIEFWKLKINYGSSLGLQNEKIYTVPARREFLALEFRNRNWKVV